MNAGIPNEVMFKWRGSFAGCRFASKHCKNEWTGGRTVKGLEIVEAGGGRHISDLCSGWRWIVRVECRWSSVV